MAPKKERIPNELRTQRVIDPQTGRDITGEYIARRLKELERIADEIVNIALDESTIHPSKKKEIYEKAYWEIQEKLGMGSIGPTTAAAAPLMDKKKIKLAEALGVDKEDRIH